MYGKMTTSRMGIIGNRLVSDFSLEVSIVCVMQKWESDLQIHFTDVRRRKGGGLDQPAFSSNVTLIFWASTISFVTRNSLTFLYEGR